MSPPRETQSMRETPVQRGRVNRYDLVGSICERSSIKIAHLVPICQQTWPPQAILVSDWLISKKSSLPLKPLGQMNRNLVGSIIGRSSIKLLIQFRSVNKNGCHRPFLFLIGRFLKIFFSVTAQPNEPKLGGKHLWKVLYSGSSKQNER